MPEAGGYALIAMGRGVAVMGNGKIVRRSDAGASGSNTSLVFRLVVSHHFCDRTFYFRIPRNSRCQRGIGPIGIGCRGLRDRGG